MPRPGFDLHEIADRIGVDPFFDEKDRPVVCVSGGDEPHAMIALPEGMADRALIPAKHAVKLGLELVRLGEVLLAARDRGFDEGLDAGRDSERRRDARERREHAEIERRHMEGTA